MSRARNIKPGFFKNEDLAECSPWARLCFAGLWMLADREGRLEDRPKRIKGELFAYDSIEVDPLLDELQAQGFLVRYRNTDGSFIQISRFAAHQTPHYSEKASVIKPHDFQESGAHDEGAKLENSSETPGNQSDDDGRKQYNSERLRGLKRGAQRPDSLIPDSLIGVPTRHRRGSRLAPDWHPGDTGMAFAETHGLANGKAAAELERFRDHWTAKTGADASKADWQATWRNWVRRAVEFGPKPGVSRGSDDPFAGAQ